MHTKAQIKLQLEMVEMKREIGPTSTPPKLSFHSLPAQRPEPPGMATPPLRRPGSVPFRWEEAPGKPRAVASISSSSKGLDLPPKLVVARMIPSTVDEPNPQPSCRLWYSVSLREGRLSSSSIGSTVGRRGGRRAMRMMMTWPWRKGSFGGFEDASTPSSVSSGSGSGSSSFSSSSEFYSNSNNYEGKTATTMRMMRRSRSLSDVGNAGAHWLANIYGVIRQVIPRRKD